MFHSCDPIEKPEPEEGCDKKILFAIVSKTFTSIIFKIVDIGTDLGNLLEYFGGFLLNPKLWIPASH